MKLSSDVLKTRSELRVVYGGILSLLKKRLRLVSKIKKEKKKLGIAFKDLDQEKLILKRAGKFKNEFKEILKKKI